LAYLQQRTRGSRESVATAFNCSVEERRGEKREEKKIRQKREENREEDSPILLPIIAVAI
jgi:hypothetical protein